MIHDTLCCYSGVKCIDINDVIVKVSNKWTVDRHTYVNNESSKYAYKGFVIFKNLIDSKKTITLCYGPKLFHVPQIKFKAEISNFNGIKDFEHCLLNLSASSSWKMLMNNHFIGRLDLKCDFIGVKFEVFKKYLINNYARKPKLLINPIDGRRTLYISKNHYFYEKHQNVIRWEIRLKTSKQVRQKLGIKEVKELKLIKLGDYLSLFESNYFVEINQPLLNNKFDQLRIQIIQVVDDSSGYQQVQSNGRDYILSNNALVCVRVAFSKKYGKSINRNIFNKLQKIDFGLRDLLIQEFKNSIGEKYDQRNESNYC